MKVGGGNNYNLQHIGKAKLQKEGRLPTAIKCIDEDLYVANVQLNGDTKGVVGSLPDVLDMLMDSMDVFNMFLSDLDATFASENGLEPLHLN